MTNISGVGSGRSPCAAFGGPQARSWVWQLAFAALVTLERWQARTAERRLLAGMSDYHLKDIGLSRADVEGETAKHFWQV
jgi:uncharacterized protein YjiS (DUF1127 family)